MKRLGIRRAGVGSMVLAFTMATMGTLAIGTGSLRAQDAGSPPPPPASAQPGDTASPGAQPSMEQMRERHVAMMTQQLNLSPSQATQLQAITKDSMTQMMALRQDTTLPKREKRAQMRKLREASQARIRAMLTDEQKPRYDAMVANERERMKQRHDQPEGGPGAAGAMGAPPPPATPPQTQP